MSQKRQSVKYSINNDIKESIPLVLPPLIKTDEIDDFENDERKLNLNTKRDILLQDIKQIHEETYTRYISLI